MKNPLVLTFDCGTQSLRAVLMDKEGTIIGKEQEKYQHPYYSKNPGWAEQPASVYWNAVCKTSKALKEKCSERWDDIICVTVSAIRDTYTCIDKDGNILRDFIVWLDQRTAECKEPLPATSRLAFSIAGMTNALDVQRKITKSNWIRENEPEIWEKAHKYISVGGSIIYNLTGEMKDSAASMIGHIPFDYKNKKWKSEKDIQFAMFGVDKEKLLEMVEPCGTLGYITKKAEELTGIKEGLPVIATGSDKGCETLGAGVIDNKGASLSFGTASTVQISTSHYVEPEPLLPAYPAVIPTLYNPEVQIYRGYWMITWFLKEFAEKEVKQAKELGCSPEELLNKELANIPAGCDGLVLQPYWSPFLKQPEGKGCIIGFSSVHTRVHIYRAIIEGIGFALYDALQNLQKRSKNKTEYLVVNGGGSQSDAICQITADMFNLPVRRIQNYEATSLGSSIAGFVAMGEYSSFEEASSKMTHYRDEFIPNKEVHEIYEKLYSQVYKKTYEHLRPLYVKLYEILKHNKGDNND